MRSVGYGSVRPRSDERRHEALSVEVRTITPVDQRSETKPLIPLKLNTIKNNH